MKTYKELKEAVISEVTSLQAGKFKNTEKLAEKQIDLRLGNVTIPMKVELKKENWEKGSFYALEIEYKNYKKIQEEIGNMIIAQIVKTFPETKGKLSYDSVGGWQNIGFVKTLTSKSI